MSPSPPLSLMSDLRQALAQRFDGDELRSLCFELGIDYEDLKGEGKEGKARELVSYFARRGRLADLLAAGKRLRPDVDWDAFAAAGGAPGPADVPSAGTRRFPFRRSPALILAGAAVLIAAAILASRVLPSFTPGSGTAPGAGPSGAGGGAPASAAAAATAIAGSCFEGYFSDLSAGRLALLHAGARSLWVFGPNLPKDPPLGLVFMDDNQPVGALRFTAVPANRFFRIDGMVDARCSKTEDYANTTRGGDGHVLQHADTLGFRLAAHEYELRLEFAEGWIVVNHFTRVSP